MTVGISDSRDNLQYMYVLKANVNQAILHCSMESTHIYVKNTRDIYC